MPAGTITEPPTRRCEDVGVVDPFREVRAFVTAALVTPVARNRDETDAVRRRRRVIAGLTLVAGSCVLAAALRVPPGNAWFYLATVALALVWSGGAVLSGPLHLGRAHTRAGTTPGRPVVQSLALGTGLLAVFLVGSIVVARVPVLRAPVDALLDHARVGSLPLVTAITVVNGVAEELYFRGAAYAAVGRRHAVLWTTLGYTVVTAAAGIPLLVLAAAVVGVVTGLQRRVTGGVLGPIVTHLTWSVGMLFLLPEALDRFG